VIQCPLSMKAFTGIWSLVYSFVVLVARDSALVRVENSF